MSIPWLLSWWTTAVGKCSSIHCFLISTLLKIMIIRTITGIQDTATEQGDSELYHCKNTWITLTTFLGYFSCINVVKEYYQIGKASLVTLVSEDLFAYIPCIYTTSHATKELRACRCNIKEQQTSPRMLIYRFSEKLYYFNKRGKHLNYT